MRTDSWKQTAIRAGRTFVQAFVGYIAANLAYDATNFVSKDAIKNWLIGIFIAALSAGLAALMNLPKKQ